MPTGQMARPSSLQLVTKNAFWPASLCWLNGDPSLSVDVSVPLPSKPSVDLLEVTQALISSDHLGGSRNCVQRVISIHIAILAIKKYEPKSSEHFCRVISMLQDSISNITKMGTSNTAVIDDNIERARQFCKVGGQHVLMAQASILVAPPSAILT
jgi:hypothetical protein